MTKHTYYRRRDAGLCTECGEPLPASWKHRKCKRCLQVPETHPRPIGTEKRAKFDNISLEEMVKEAHRRGVSYGRLQTEETVERIRYADRTNMTLKRWGRQVMFG